MNDAVASCNGVESISALLQTGNKAVFPTPVFR